jgi:hypothetical protein
MPWVSLQTLHNWVARGAPVVGTGAERRHPLPHLFAWAIEFQRREGSGQVVERLPSRVTLALHRARCLEEEAKLAGPQGPSCTTHSFP